MKRLTGILPGVATLDDEVAGMVVVLSDNSGYQISTGGLQIVHQSSHRRRGMGAWTRRGE